MSLCAPLARGLLVTVPLAGLCLAVPAHGQYASTNTYPSTGTSGYGASYPVTPVSGSAAYYVAQAPLEHDMPEAPLGPQESQVNLPVVSDDAGYVPPPHNNTPVYGNASPQNTAPMYNGAGSYSAYPGASPYAASSYASTGSYAGAEAYAAGGAVIAPGGGVYNPYSYNANCVCPDGGYSTWGMWSNYAHTSPCQGGAGSHCNWGGRVGFLFGGHGCHACSTGSPCNTCAVGTAAPCAEGCTSCQPASCAAPCRIWFGGIYALAMTRDDENPAWVSFDSSNIANQVLSSRDGAVEWQPGNELRFGSIFLCHCLGWEFAYWGMYEEDDEAVITAADIGAPVSTVLDFGGLDYDDGGGVSGVNAYFDGAQAHRVRRNFALQNLELNLLYYPFMDSVGPYGVSRAGSAFHSGRRFSVTGSAGFRYVRVDDDFQFATSFSDTVFGNAAEDLFYDIDMDNHLVGFQFGGAADYRATQRLSLYFDSKVGVFLNFIEHESRIYGSNGFAVVTGGLPFAGQQFNLESSKEDVAFLGELRLGLAYWVTPRWRLYGGWRALGIAGYAHPTEQIPLNFAGIPDVIDIDSNGSLIVHGLQLGVEANY